MPRPEFSAFLNRVLGHVRFALDRPAIREELFAHLEDKTERLLADGLTEEEACHRAVEEMGDPDLLGRELNRVHNPVLGWLWRISGYAAAVTAVLLILSCAQTLYFSVTDTREKNIRENHEIVREIEVDETIHIDSRVVHLDKLLLDSDNTAHLLYDYWYDRPFENGWSFSLSWIEDDAGNVYYGGGMLMGGGMRERAVIEGEDIPPDTATLYAVYKNYDRFFRVPISLEEGESDA